MSNVQDQKRIALLQQYVLCLQRQNFAKNGQTSLLYEQLESLRQQNQMLKSFIESTRTKWQEEKQQLTEKLLQKEQNQISNSRNFGDQLKNSVDVSSLKALAEDMQFQLEARQNQISQLSQQKMQLESQVHLLKKQLTQATNKALRSEQKLRNQMQYVKQLQNQIYGLKNSRVENRSGVSFAKLEVDKLVKQNNELIQKLRLLQKQKNGYYNQLKMTSPAKSRMNKQNKSAQKRSQCIGKSEKWGIMEQKLRAIRSQNEQLKANLAII